MSRLFVEGHRDARASSGDSRRNDAPRQETNDLQNRTVYAELVILFVTAKLNRFLNIHSISKT